MRKKHLILLSLILFFTITIAYAQKAPMKFGKVNIEDLKMTEYPPDPSAPAVVLCSYGFYDNIDNRFVQMMRVKIFKKEGYDFATRKFPTAEKSSIRGKTFNLVEGKIVEDRLSGKSVYSEKIIDNYYLVSIAMPNVKEGSIIDIEIQYTGFPTSWYFQEDIPVVWSELRIATPKYVSYRKNYFGYVPLTINEGGRWVAENVPAFKKEPFMDSKENYISKFEIDLTEINVEGYYYQELAKTWNGLSKLLLDYEYFGDLLKSGMFMNKEAKRIKMSDQTDEEKIKAAVDFVKQVDYNEKDRVVGTNSSLSGVYNNKAGNSAELNIMLTRLLQKIGYRAMPVVLSTKDNGRITYHSPSVRRLNYVLAYVWVKDHYMLLDATDKLLPFDMIPEKCLNDRGRLVNTDSSRWVQLKTDKKFKEVVFYDLHLEEDLTLTGKLSNRRSEYAAYAFRKKMENYVDNEEYTNSLAEKYPGLEIVDMETKNLENLQQPVSDIYDVRITDRVYEMDSTLYLQLALFEKMEENPFKAKERTFPVDFGIPIEKSGIVKITIPDDFKIVEVPKNLSFALPDKAASFIYRVSRMGNVVTLQYKLLVNKTMFQINEYPELKAFYNEVIKKESEPLVLKTL